MKTSTMKRWLLAALIATPLSASAAGFAGLSYVTSKIEPDHGGSASPHALGFKFGSWINRDETLGGEVRLGLGVGDDSLGHGTKVQVDRSYGAYLRGEFPNTVPIRPYGLIGVTRIKTTEDRPSGHHGKSYQDLSLGLGADFTLTRVVFVSLEYLRAVDRGGDQVSNLSLGINGRF